ncbi:MAG: HAMP domain-containing histidine kinase, partial [Bdellovibrionaceae bacterium]|nr:HAMP domain-containing histidine kinase [Pseudobdellovibrionaceae bacterium]
AWQFVFLGIGFSLIGAAGYFWYEKRNPRFAATAAAAPPAKPAQEVLPPIPSVSMENVVTPPPRKPLPPAGQLGDVVTTNSSLLAPIAPKSAPPTAMPFGSKGGDSVPAPATPPDWQQEKAEAYRSVAAAMGQEMRAPLASILGFSQMVLSKTQDPDVVQAVESILREARSSRDVLDKLVTFSGERNAKKSSVKIEGPIIQALKNLDQRLVQKGVRIDKDFQESNPWPIATEEMTKVFENIIENSIEGMERMQEKSIKISVWESSQGLHVRIVDTGEGIDRENLGKVFEPFFTTRSYANHVGLGLPVSAGILKEHSAQFKIQSQRGKGTQVDIVLPPVNADALSSGAGIVPEVLLDAHDLPAELPKISSPTRDEIQTTMQDTEPTRDRLTEINVDRLLEDLPNDDGELQFLDGMGFDDPALTAPLPIMEALTAVAIPPKPVATPPPVMSQPPMKAPPPAAAPHEQVVVVLDNNASAPPKFAPPIVAIIPEPEAEIPTEVAPEPPQEVVPEPKVLIDAPTPSSAAKSSDLDSYKVEVKRPGKRT